MIEEIKPTIYLMCGMVCSGKTTRAKRIERQQAAVRFNTDEWISVLFEKNMSQKQFRVVEKKCELLFLKIAKQLLKNGISVVLDFGFWKKQSRLKYKRLAKRMNAKCVLYYMNYSKTTLNQRRRKRNKRINKNLIITDEMFGRFLKEFEEPTVDEGIKIITAKNNNLI